MKTLIGAAALILAGGLAVVAPATAGPADVIVNHGTTAESAAEQHTLPGEDIAGITRARANVDSGEIDRSANIRNIARIPLHGRFAEPGAFGTDLAFKGRFAYAGNYLGVTVYDIKDPANPERVGQILCPGAQNDLSIYKNLLIASVDSLRNNDTCKNRANSSAGVPVPNPNAWEGIRVFDISKPRQPKLLTSVLTDCGSHTNTLAPSRDGKSVFVYVSSYSPSPTLPNCQPPHDKISIVKVPVDNGAAAEVVATPVLFPDGGTTGDDYSSDTSGCHDITAYPAKNIAAGACMGDGILMDITNRAAPKVINRVKDTENFAFWHSATFNNAGTKVVFTDELGGGGGAECNPEVGDERGANGIYDIVNNQLKFRSYYKIPRVQSDTENCVAHNGSLIPVKGRDIMVQAWYQGGQSIFDFTDSSNPRELEHFDRGAISDEQLQLGGSWSTYWYNGYVYSSDITRGLEVFRVKTDYARQARSVRTDVFNAQSQPSYNG